MRARKSATGSVRLIPSPSFPVRPPRLFAVAKRKPAEMLTTVISGQCSVGCRSVLPQPPASATTKLITDHCSLTTVLLPARLDDAGNLTLERQRPETQAAN